MKSLPQQKQFAKKQKSILLKRDFYGEDFYKSLLGWYEEMRAFRNKISSNKSKPTEEEILKLKLNKSFETIYKKMLSDETLEDDKTPKNNT